MATHSHSWDRVSLIVVTVFCAVKTLAHFLLVNRYGYHGDELYFVECGRHFALGYVDQPPLIPWIARLGDELGGSLFALRFLAIAAGTGTMIFTALLVREWGGTWRAQFLAMLCLLAAPAHLRMGAMLDIPVIEVFFCTVTTYLVARSLSRDGKWTWVLAGAASGLAILSKHSSLLWGAALAIGILATPHRRVLLRPWPWFGALTAFLLFLPNLIWQVQNDFVMLDFMSTARQEVLATQGRLLFLAGQILYFHPLAVPVWIAGTLFAFTKSGRSTLPFALVFMLLFVFYLTMGGKPYYLASAYPAVLAMGGIWMSRWFESHLIAWRTFATSFVLTGAAFAVLSLPILPLQTLDKVIDALFGWAVPPMALTHDMHGEYGWKEQAATIDQVYRSLPENERALVSVFAGNYSQAAAVNLFRHQDTPRAVSGNMTYHLWGPDGKRGAVLIAYGLPREVFARHYRSCTLSAHLIHAPLARPWERDLPVYVCREPIGTMDEFWADVRRFGTAFIVQ